MKNEENHIDIIGCLDCRNMVLNEDVSATLQAKSVGGYSLNYINPIVYSIQGNVIGRQDHNGPAGGV